MTQGSSWNASVSTGAPPELATRSNKLRARRRQLELFSGGLATTRPLALDQVGERNNHGRAHGPARDLVLGHGDTCCSDSVVFDDEGRALAGFQARRQRLVWTNPDRAR